MRLLVVALVGCSSSARAPSQEAVERCVRGAQAMLASMQQVTFARPGEDAKLLACADLYRAPACAQAWRDAFAETAIQPAPLIAEACAHAYCAELSPPPALCTQPYTDVEQLRELDTAILTFEGVEPAAASAIARRTGLFRTVVVNAPPRTSAAAPETLVLELDEAGQLSIAGTRVERAALPSLFASLATKQGRLLINARPDTSHGKVVELLEAAKQAGVTRVMIGREP